MVRETLVELARVVQPSGYVAFEVGEVRNGKDSRASRLGTQPMDYPSTGCW